MVGLKEQDRGRQEEGLWLLQLYGVPQRRLKRHSAAGAQHREAEEGLRLAATTCCCCFVAVGAAETLEGAPA